MNALVYIGTDLLLITPDLGLVPRPGQGTWWELDREPSAGSSSCCSPATTCASPREHQIEDVDEEYATRRHPPQDLSALL